MTVHRTKDVKVVMINRKTGVEYELKGFLSSSTYQDINTPIKELFKVHVNPSWKELLNIQRMIEVSFTLLFIVVRILTSLILER